MADERITELLVGALGMCGRLLSQSKSSYSIKHPHNRVFFNANVLDARAQKVWYGDVDLTADASVLQSIADALGEPFYVARETPWRWNETDIEALEAEVATGERSSVVKISPVTAISNG